VNFGGYPTWWRFEAPLLQGSETSPPAAITVKGNVSSILGLTFADYIPGDFGVSNTPEGYYPWPTVTAPDGTARYPVRKDAGALAQSGMDASGDYWRVAGLEFLEYLAGIDFTITPTAPTVALSGSGVKPPVSMQVVEGRAGTNSCSTTWTQSMREAP